METLTVKIPNDRSTDVTTYIKNIGGEVVAGKKEQVEADEVTHGVFFGENIKRVIKAFRKH